VAAASYNFSPLLRWLTALLRAVIAKLLSNRRDAKLEG